MFSRRLPRKRTRYNPAIAPLRQYQGELSGLPCRALVSLYPVATKSRNLLHESDSFGNSHGKEAINVKIREHVPDTRGNHWSFAVIL